jgi:glycosyltransferase involved in cell wall biosynthesis
VIFDGIDADRVCPNPQMSIAFNGGKLNLSRNDEVVTYVSRGLEPLRGLHPFIRSIPLIQKANPRAQILVVGDKTPAYSESLQGQSYLDKYLAEMKGQIDLTKVRFLGKLAYEQYLAILQLSSVHIYLTYPFVLSWSLLEAMSAGCAVVGSKTAPVEEVLRDGHNGLLVDFFSPEEIANAVSTVLAHPDRMQEMRKRARETILDDYDFKRACFPRQLAFFKRVTS